jgi:hypothetical protein
MSLKLNSAAGGSVTLQEPSTASNFVLDLPAASGTLLVPGQASAIVSGTAVASTSGTSIDFTGIPSWVKRITVMLSSVSTNAATYSPLIQLGDSGGIEDTGYVGGFATPSSSSGSTTGFIVYLDAAAASNVQAQVNICLLTGNTWSAGGTGYGVGYGAGSTSGTKTLSATLDRIRITTIAGTGTFDAGSINILYE